MKKTSRNSSSTHLIAIYLHISTFMLNIIPGGITDVKGAISILDISDTIIGIDIHERFEI